MIRGLSVITVCMNRQHHLLTSAQKLASWPHHEEHLILDWSSHDPVKRSQLPDDPRIRLERVEGEERWNLCRAYNFAARLAIGMALLKLDADCWPEALNPESYLANSSQVCWFGSGPDGRLGQFLMHRGAFEKVGGFNEVLLGYGFDDKDLKARLLSLGFSVGFLPEHAVGVIPHSIHERVGRRNVNWDASNAFQESLSFAQQRATAMSSRVAAAYTPWTGKRRASSYELLCEGLWRCEVSSIPIADESVAAELARLRRQVFWGRFLEIPESVVSRLPTLLLPLDRQGDFPLRWWHVLYWFSLRQVVLLIVITMEPGFWRRLRSKN